MKSEKGIRSISIQQFFTKEASPDGNSKKSGTQKESGEESCKESSSQEKSSEKSCKESSSQEKSSEEEVRDFSVQFLSIDFNNGGNRLAQRLPSLFYTSLFYS